LHSDLFVVQTRVSLRECARIRDEYGVLVADYGARSLSPRHRYIDVAPHPRSLRGNGDSFIASAEGQVPLLDVRRILCQPDSGRFAGIRAQIQALCPVESGAANTSTAVSR